MGECKAKPKEARSGQMAAGGLLGSIFASLYLSCPIDQ